MASYAEIDEPFHRLANEVVWCSLSTVDTKHRTRIRLVHPIWDGAVGLSGTGRHGSSDRHITRTPHVSVSYTRLGYDPLATEQAYADCTAEFDDSLAAKQEFWDLCLKTPLPLGFDPALAWKSVENADFGLLRLTPWRIEVASLDMSGWKQQIWRAH